MADDLDLEPADRRPPVAHAGERDRVADEHQAVGRLGPGDEPPQRRMDVDPVGDEFDVGVVVGERRHGEARVLDGPRRSSH